VASFDRSRAVVARASAASGRPVLLRFDLPAGISAPPIWLGVSSADLAAEVSRVDLEPIAVSAHTDADVPTARVVENIDGEPGAYLMYLDDEAYPEGGVFWTRGRSTARLVAYAEQASVLVLDTASGAAGGHATVEANGVAHAFDLPAESRHVIELPLTSDAARVSLRVSFSGAFRPSDVGQSQDHRSLGLRIHPRLGRARVEAASGM
jgi:hypothetical protein